MLPSSQWKSWSNRIRHFTWTWHAVVMGTGSMSALWHNFPYHNGSQPLKILSLALFLLNLFIFTFVAICTIVRYTRYPEIWSKMISHPSQSLFIGCFPMGVITLIDSAITVNQDWGLGGLPFLYALWGLWWFDCLLSYMITFGMTYTMMVKQNHTIVKMTTVWLLPVVTLVVASSAGGLLAEALKPHSPHFALITSGFSLTMLSMGLSFSVMMLTVYLLRLIIHGPPDATQALSAFMALGPLGQGGYSLLLHGQLLSELIPLHIGMDFPQSALAGQMIFSACFCVSYVLFSMALAWVIMAFCSFGAIIRHTTVPFSMAYWGLIFPNGVFASLVLQLGKLLDSPFFRAFGAVWGCIAFSLWLFVFSRSIPPFIDGSLFTAPYVRDGIPSSDSPGENVTKTAVEESQLRDRLSRLLTASPLRATHEVKLERISDSEPSMV